MNWKHAIAALGLLGSLDAPAAQPSDRAALRVAESMARVLAQRENQWDQMTATQIRALLTQIRSIRSDARTSPAEARLVRETLWRKILTLPGLPPVVATAIQEELNLTEAKTSATTTPANLPEPTPVDPPTRFSPTDKPTLTSDDPVPPPTVQMTTKWGGKVGNKTVEVQTKEEVGASSRPNKANSNGEDELEEDTTASTWPEPIIYEKPYTSTYPQYVASKKAEAEKNTSKFWGGVGVILAGLAGLGIYHRTWRTFGATEDILRQISSADFQALLVDLRSKNFEDLIQAFQYISEAYQELQQKTPKDSALTPLLEGLGQLLVGLYYELKHFPKGKDELPAGILGRFLEQLKAYPTVSLEQGSDLPEPKFDGAKVDAVTPEMIKKSPRIQALILTARDIIRSR